MVEGGASKEKIRQFARGALASAGISDVSYVPLDEVARSVGLQKANLWELGEEVPAQIKDVLKRLRGTVLGLLAMDERKYFVDRSMSVPRQRFTEGHEIGHDALPWHRAAFFGDDHSTLDPDTKVVLEAEASQFASELLFGAGRFTSEADDYAPSLDVPLYLADGYGVSKHAAFRKYVEESRHPIALLAFGRYPARGRVKLFRAQSFESEAFRERYGSIVGQLGERVPETLYPEFAALNGRQSGRADECHVTVDTNRGPVRFKADGFTNGRLNFVILRRQTRRAGQRLRLVSVEGDELLPAG